MPIAYEKLIPISMIIVEKIKISSVEKKVEPIMREKIYWVFSKQNPAKKINTLSFRPKIAESFVTFIIFFGFNYHVLYPT